MLSFVNLLPSQGEIFLNSDVSIGECPALSCLIEKDHPQEVMLLRVVNEDMSPTLSFGCVDWDWWVELQHHAKRINGLTGTREK